MNSKTLERDAGGLSPAVAEFLDHWLPAQYAGMGAVASNNGSLLLSVDGARWWLGAREGRIVRRAATAEDTALLRLDTSNAAFERLVVDAPRSEGAKNPALRLLELDPATSASITSAQGAVRLVVSEGEGAHELTLGSGQAQRAVVCTLHLSLADLRAVQAGELSAFDLFIGGQLRIDGDMETALSLGSLFV